jgi:hypothetical protein
MTSKPLPTNYAELISKLPGHRPGKTQGRLDSKETKKLLEKADVHTTKHGPVRPLGGPPDNGLNSYPLTALGIVYAGANLDFSTVLSTSIGVMVGPDLLLTAGHVVPWGQAGWWMNFVPTQGTPSPTSSYVSEAQGYNVPAGSVSADDLAICKLYTPLGSDTTGWMGTLSWSSDSSYKGPTFSIDSYEQEFGGYSLNINPRSVTNVVDDGQFKLLEVVNLIPGPVGAVMWYEYSDGGSPYVIGILSGAVNVGEGDYGFAGGPAFVSLVQWAYSNWE